MFDWLKRHFVPHEENDHRPHFLHSGNMLQIIGVVLFFELILFIIPTLNFVNLVKTSNLSSVLPAVLAMGTNNERESNDLPDLVTNNLLTKAAQMKAEDMAAKGYFSHNSPDGKTPWSWIDAVGYQYEYAGENLAVNFTDSKDVTDAWMNSPTHRDNIVKANYTEMGTGVAMGMYKGRESIFVVQLYANPKIVPHQDHENTRLAVEDALKIKVATAATVETKPEPVQTKQTPTVLGESTDSGLSNPQRTPSVLESTLASPRHTTDTVLYVVLGIVLAALFLAVMIKFEHQHPDLVANGLLVVVFVFGAFIVNAYIAKAGDFQTSYTDTSQASAQK